ncbi:phytoene desaturase family protein [Aeropyrum camini]|uniref:Oxidoreductase n=1 Tax=Aeropyrum camini SY1 = JCM 12091 TaxID=1198449 RepID=U3TF12_9CREN|nr:NAD(P)/FAD-dependent oxidoreductase [Aeropyrum camini]BAN90610.1 oxidoreductase [Aeropyrum camini SY1 = JCM 12091]
MPRYDAVVVGGGHNGLVAALTLALHGARVALVEARDQLGGLSSDGLSLGVRYPRVAYALGLFPEGLARFLGVNLGAYTVLAEPSWVVVDASSGETIFRWWTSFDALMQEFVERGLPQSEARAFVSLLDSWRRCSGEVIFSVRPPSLEEASEVLSRCGGEQLGSVFRKRFEKGLGQLLPRDLWGLVTYPGYESEPGAASLLHIWNGGVWRQIPGGWAPLLLDLEEKARRSGVDIFKGLGPAGIMVKGERVKGVRIGKRVFEADRVIYSGSIVALPEALGDSKDVLGSEVLREIDRISRTSLVADRLNIFTSCKPEPFYRAGGRPSLVEVWGRGYWFEAAYPTLHPEGRDSLSRRHVVALTGLFGGADPYEILNAAGVSCVDRVESIDKHVLAMEFLNSSGNPNHVPLNDGRILDRRPFEGWSDYTTPVEGLYHGSASSHPGGQVSGVPGHNAAVRLLVDAGVKPRSPLAKI